MNFDSKEGYMNTTHYTKGGPITSTIMNIVDVEDYRVDSDDEPVEEERVQDDEDE